jgi:hypothetical protein
VTTHTPATYTFIGFWMFFGVVSVLQGLFGKEFYFALLGSRQKGPPMPKWFGRPFFVIWGFGALYFAVDLLRNS